MKTLENPVLTSRASSGGIGVLTTNPPDPMSQFDKTHLETNFQNWKKERCPDDTDGDAFEMYAIEQVLKSKDPSDDDIEYGNIGGSRDGGIDGFYLFYGQKLVREGSKFEGPVATAELVIIQSKYSDSFEETPIIKLKKFSEVCFDWGKNLDSVNYINSEVKDLIAMFRNECQRIQKDDPELLISFHYVSKSTHKQAAAADTLANELRQYVNTQITHAKVEFKFWDCVELLKSVRAGTSKLAMIPTSKFILLEDGCTICLVKLTDYAKFITDEKEGQINAEYLEPNVRDFQGKTNINSEIRQTVDSKEMTPEFWWLNNGITIVAESCDFGAGQVKIRRPEIVNGLQTSHQIFESFKENPTKTDTRHILLRIIVAKEETTRNRIIKATNNQNPMSDLQIKSTDPVHFNIEDGLRRYGFFYDRRKGQSRRERRPISKTISPYALAQMVIAIYLQRPSEARSRPKNLIDNDKTYQEIFDEKHDVRFYVSCLLLHRQVKDFMARTVPEKDIRARLRYQVSMLSACELVKSAKPTIELLAGLADALTAPVEEKIFTDCLAIARSEYDKNATDKYSKSVEFQDKLKDFSRNKLLPQNPSPSPL